MLPSWKEAWKSWGNEYEQLELISTHYAGKYRDFCRMVSKQAKIFWRGRHSVLALTEVQVREIRRIEYEVLANHYNLTFISLD